MVMKFWPFSEALAIIFAKSFLELEEKFAMTAETPLSMLVLNEGSTGRGFFWPVKSWDTVQYFQSTIYEQGVFLVMELK